MLKVAVNIDPVSSVELAVLSWLGHWVARGARQRERAKDGSVIRGLLGEKPRIIADVVFLVQSPHLGFNSGPLQSLRELRKLCV